MDYQEIIDFWFTEITPAAWFKKDTEFDQLIESRFLSIHTAANQCELYHWRDSAQGRLAEIIVLDQFSRNIYRDTAAAFSSDALALALAQEAIHVGSQLVLSAEQRAFLYMPFMHSESAAIQEVSLELFADPDLKDNYEFALQHKDIIDRFGRYPHRNHLLGRDSTEEEQAFLQQPNSSF